MNLNTSITKPLLNETNKSMVMATRNMPEFENEAQTDLYCVRRELALVGQTQFTQSLEEGYTRSLSSDEAAIVVAEAHEILEALKEEKEVEEVDSQRNEKAEHQGRSRRRCQGWSGPRTRARNVRQEGQR